MALTLTCRKFLRLSVTNRYFFKHLSTTSPEKKGLVLGVYSDEEGEGLQLTPAAEKYNQISQGKLVENIKLLGNKVKPGQSFLFWGLDPGFASVALVGLGTKSKPFDDIELIYEENESIRIAAAAGCNALNSAGIKAIHVDGLGHPESAAEAATLATWMFQEYKTKPIPLPKVALFSENQTEHEEWQRGQIKGNAQNLVRRLQDTPANLLTPTIFAETAKTVVKDLNISVKIRDQAWAEKEKMNAFLSVARGSIEPPRFVELSYENSGESPFVLVGKGVTFDAGGICLKSANFMDQMRADMSGAACVLGTMYALAQLNTPVNLKVLIPLVENLPSGCALKPGDVVWARNGKSICVDDTDNEGRLILADALSYSEIFKPKWVLDIATLTLECREALGSTAVGVYTNSNKLYEILQEAGANTGDRVWRMPLWKDYRKYITEFNAYDINNVGARPGKGGSCIAAAFLKEFIPKNTDWVHIDMAGVMGPDPSCPYLSKGMPGRPTRTLIEFIEAQTRK